MSCKSSLSTLVIVSAVRSKDVAVGFICMSIIPIVPLCLVIVSSSSLLLSVPREACASSLWPFLSNFIYHYIYMKLYHKTVTSIFEFDHNHCST